MRIINDVKRIELDDCPNCELLIDYTAMIDVHTRTEECHGLHELDESDIQVNIHSVELVIGGVGSVVKLSKSQKEYLEQYLVINENI